MKAPGATVLRVLRADSVFFGHDVVAACRRHKSHASILARQDPAVRKAIVSIDPDLWRTIKYPNAVYDEEQQRWIDDADVTEIHCTAPLTLQGPAFHRPTDRAAHP